jgi:signal transduction histidine kinase
MERNSISKIRARPKSESRAHKSHESQSAELLGHYRELVGAIARGQSDHADLITAARMTCLADFVAAIAHEINNPLGAMAASANSLKRAAEKLGQTCADDRQPHDNESSRLAKVLKVVEDNAAIAQQAANRLADTVRRLKRFAHHDEASYQLIDINDSLDRALGLIESGIDGSVQITKDYDNLSATLAYPKLLNEAFLAIIRNAIRAVEEEGSIKITTAQHQGFIIVSISDDGHGIPPEKQSTLFDFAFTATRERVGVQTGLSSSYHAVKLHNGDIRVDSAEGMGTTVTVSLPIISDRCEL